MKRKLINSFLLAAAAVLACACGATKTAALSAATDINAGDRAIYVVATDYAPADGTTDVADLLQKMIDENPRRTIFFPDGEYLLSHPIATPADPMKAVHIRMGNFAILKADKEAWGDAAAVLKLGGKDPANNTTTPGSNYGIEGGIIDGSGVADGISIDSGRETRITGVSIKNTRIGIHIKYGANSGSSDSDIRDVNIIGNGTKEAIGVLIEGFDNTFTNMRLCHVHTGIWCKSAGNSLKNIHPLYGMGDGNYPESRAFVVEMSNNWFDYCYSDQFAKGFVLENGVEANLINCFAYWYSGKVPFQTAIECNGAFDSLVYGFHAGFSDSCANVALLTGSTEGKGRIYDTYMSDREMSPEDVSARFSHPAAN